MNIFFTCEPFYLIGFKQCFVFYVVFVDPNTQQPIRVVIVIFTSDPTRPYILDEFTPVTPVRPEAMPLQTDAVAHIKEKLFNMVNQNPEEIINLDRCLIFTQKNTDIVFNMKNYFDPQLKKLYSDTTDNELKTELEKLFKSVGQTLESK